LGQHDAAVLAWVSSARAIAAGPAGEFGRAIGLFQESHRLALESGQVRQAILAATNAADNFSILGDLETALAWVERALALARRTGWPSMLGSALMQTGNILRLLGRCAEADAALREALSARAKLQESNGFLVTLGYLGDVCLDLGRPAEALEHYSQAERHARRLGGAISLLRILRGQAHALCRLGQSSAAWGRIAAALDLARTEGSPDELVDTLRVCAELHLRHALVIPGGATPGLSALSRLKEGMEVAERIPGYALPHEFLELTAEAHAAEGDYPEAYASALAATRLRDSHRLARNRSLALATQEIHAFERERAESEFERQRRATERIHSEAEQHRRMARSEAERAATLEETSRTLEILGQVGREVTTRLSVEEVCATLDRNLSRLLDVTSFDVYLLDTEAGLLRNIFGVEAGGSSPLMDIPLADPAAYCARCAREQDEVVVFKRADGRCENLVPGTLHTLSLLFFPMFIGERLLGVMSVQSARDHAYAERECSIFRTLCAYAAIALENASAYAAAERSRLEASQALAELRETEATRASLEIQLRESQKMEAVGTLAGGIAHDFNNTLATILGNAELARQDAAGIPQAVASLEEIRKAASRARDLVQQILSFSRRQPTERMSMGIGPVIEAAERLLRATLPKRIILDVECPPGLPLIRADASQIQQVVINLVTNAMQAIRSHHGRIGIHVRAGGIGDDLADRHPALRGFRTRCPGEALELAVIDDGPGMDAATQQRIFEPFFTTKPREEGTGLGLSVVHGIVQSHEGVIVVESQPGHGATFRVFLPVANPAVSAEPEPGVGSANSGLDSAPRAVTPPSGPRVLYLDDDEAVVSIVTRLVGRLGYRVTGHTDQREALAELARRQSADEADGRYELLLSDYNMPGMSGLEVAREVRVIDPALSVAIASGFIDEVLLAQAADAGVRELIFKADIEEMCAAVVRLVPMPPAAGGE
ncbi:MAG: ATP-binding protein, partial [Candidatus Eisenbacteria bacterium]